MEFDFARSFVLSSVRIEGNTVLITRPLRGAIIQIPRNRVECRVIPELDDSSVQVVDFGEIDPDEVPQEAIIGVGHEDQRYPL